MNDEVKAPTNQEELSSQLNTAVMAGDQETIDRLMAVEIPDEPVVDKVGEVDETETKDEESTETVTEDGTSEEVVETKDEAATDSAASKPADTKTDQPNELETLKSELHRMKSDAGRVPSLQRRLQELERELRDTKLSRKAGEPAKEHAVDDSKVELPEALKTRIEKLREIDPDLADTLEIMGKANAASTKSAQAVAADIVKEFAQTQDKREDEAFIQQQYAKLVERVPFAPQVFKSAEWKDWKTTLSPGRLAMAESGYAEDVEIAIQAFVQDMRTRHGGVTKQPAADQTATVVDAKTSETVTKVQESRERKLNSDTATKTSAAKGTKPKLSEEDLFKAEFERIQKENHFR